MWDISLEILPLSAEFLGKGYIVEGVEMVFEKLEFKFLIHFSCSIMSDGSFFFGCVLNSFQL